jgi:hypothetical protein
MAKKNISKIVGGGDKFTTIVIICAFFITLLTWWVVYKAIKVDLRTWPNAQKSHCPDFWKYDSKNATCDNFRNLGSGACNGIKNMGEIHTAGDPASARVAFAEQCNVAWEGVNYAI